LSYLVCKPEVKDNPEIVAWSSKELAAMGPPSRNEWIMAALAVFLWSCGSNPNVSLPLLGSNFINATTVVFVIISLMPVTGVIEFNDIVREKSAWEVLFYFTSLLTLSSGLNEIGFIKWVAEGYARPLAGLSPTIGHNPAGLVLFLGALLLFQHHLAYRRGAAGGACGGRQYSRPVGTDADAAVRLFAGINGRDLALRDRPGADVFGSGYIGKGDFWKFGLIFGVIYFARLLLIVLPWLQMIGGR
jgi:di/tricarboxylate transporter